MAVSRPSGLTAHSGSSLFPWQHLQWQPLSRGGGCNKSCTESASVITVMSGPAIQLVCVLTLSAELTLGGVNIYMCMHGHQHLEHAVAAQSKPAGIQSAWGTAAKQVVHMHVVNEHAVPR
jgi:hypothetical protein